MPRKYVRMRDSTRGMWTEDALRKAFEELKENKYTINEISRRYGIPSRTLRRRFAKQDLKKVTLGKHPVLNFENEKLLATHIKKLETAGFLITRGMVRRLAFGFAEKLGIEHNFDKKTRKAGPQWLQSFLERQPGLSVREAEDIAFSQTQGLNRNEVNKLFKHLLQILTKHTLLYKPDRIFNVGEIYVQFNDKTGKEVDKKAVTSVTKKKAETMAIIACCNATGDFLPPVVVIKEENEKPEFHDGLPPGSDVYMSESAHVDADLFQKWLALHFVPRKPQGTVLLILDWDSSCTSSADMLETAEANDIILIGLPTALKPLDGSLFKPFRTAYAAENRNISNKVIEISPAIAGQLIGKAWIQVATPSNAVMGFKACGIYPYNPAEIPENLFAITVSQVHSEDENILLDEYVGLQLPGPSCSSQIFPNLEDNEGHTSPALDQTSPSLKPNPDPIQDSPDPILTSTNITAKKSTGTAMSVSREDAEQRARARPLYASSKLRASADCELIECVRARPILYDLTHSRYMDNPLKMNIWHKIARQLKASPNACKARWNNIRDNYRKSLRRQPCQGSTRYKYSSMLSFMDPFYKSKPKPGDARDTDDHPDNEDLGDKGDDDDISNDAAVEDDNKDSDTQVASETSEQIEIFNIKTDHSDVEADQSESMVDYEFFEKSSASVAGSYPSQEKAVEAFLGALAPPLKAMSPYHLSLAKAEIYAVVHKYELKGIVESGWGARDPLP